MEEVQAQAGTSVAGGSLRHLSDLPGPRKFPVVGNLLQLRPSCIHQNVEAFSRKYGSLFRLTIGRTDLLVVADHALIKEILRERPKSFRRPKVVADVSDEMGGIPGVFLAEGEQWRNERRMVMHGMAPATVKN